MSTSATRHLLAQLQQLALDLLRVVEIAEESFLIADAAFGFIHLHFALITSPRQVGEMTTSRLPESSFQGGQWRVGKIADRAQPQSVQMLLRLWSDSPQLSYRKWM